MINALANYTLNEIERASHDEFERETFYKAYAISAPPAQFLEFIVAAILAWVLPGQMSLLSFLVIVPSVLGNTIGATWLRKRVASPLVSRTWSAMAVYLIPIIAMIAGTAFNAYTPTDGHNPFAYLAGAAVGTITVLILAPFIRRYQHRRDQARLNAELED